VLSRRTTKVTRCLNLGSYNYLGFAAADEYCTPRVIETLKRFSPSTCSPRVDGGMLDISVHVLLHYVLGVLY
jgi:serine palmitoyltransferase